jgi:hypothetical protein
MRRPRNKLAAIFVKVYFVFLGLMLLAIWFRFLWGNNTVVFRFFLFFFYPETIAFFWGEFGEWSPEIGVLGSYLISVLLVPTIVLLGAIRWWVMGWILSKVFAWMQNVRAHLSK